MRLKTRGKLAAVGALALGLTLVSAPAFAGEGEAPTLTLDAGSTTFAAGSWGAGVNYTVSDIPADAVEINVFIGSMGEMGGGAVESVTIPATEVVAGSVSGNITPPADAAPVAPNADGYPKYSVGASYTYLDGAGETQWENAEGVDLVITEGASVTGPEEVTNGQLESAEGVALQFAGFVPNETLAAVIQTWSADDGYTEIGTFSVAIGADGTGVGVLRATGINDGAFLRVVAVGAESTVSYYVDVVEGAATVKPTAPERVETAA